MDDPGHWSPRRHVLLSTVVGCGQGQNKRPAAFLPSNNSMVLWGPLDLATKRQQSRHPCAHQAGPGEFTHPPLLHLPEPTNSRHRTHPAKQPLICTRKYMHIYIYLPIFGTYHTYVPPNEKHTKLSIPLLCGMPPAPTPPPPAAAAARPFDGVPSPPPPPPPSAPCSSLTARAAAAAPGFERETTGEGAIDPPLFPRRRMGRIGVTGERGRDPAFAVGAAEVGTGTNALPR